ncbi:metal ABC transporter permease [Elioraea thermophila]|uniref:metal ABC transporter permease n=1 Tax=Elioraea thermophila TaxID=2185104 RepID=UPI000DF3823E|nr:metal ABC transporter permease [Elioraea thermophila]
MLLDALTLNAGHNAAVVVLGTAAFGLAAGAVGAFVLLRGRALIADAAAHAMLPGVAGAFLLALALGGDPRALPALLAGAAVAAALAVLAVDALAATGRLKDDAAMALVLSVGFGLGMVLFSVVQALPVGGQAGLKGFILGQAAGMLEGDALLIAGLAIAAAALLALLFRPLALLCFDPSFAAAVGLPVRALDLVLLSLMLGVAVIGLGAVGALMVVGLMVIPAATARLLTGRLATMVVLSALLGAASAWIGSAVSAARPGLPTGATIVLVASALFVLALLFAPERGIVARTMQRVPAAPRRDGASPGRGRSMSAAG